jgi:uncharacterized membrane protein YdjX (TVP38/TMEM64 family)
VRRLLRLIVEMDARAWRALAVAFALFGGVGVILLFGASLLGIQREAEVERWLGFAAQSPVGLLIVIAAFSLLAFLGAPQVALYAAAVVAFGPMRGCLYSWIATEVSACVGFWVGRAFGSRLDAWLQRPAIARFMQMIGENGFVASLLVRLVPSAPFIVVNMAAGVSPMRFTAFAAGTGLGIVPKIVLTAFAGHSAARALKGGGVGHVALIVLAVVLWVGVGWVARRWLKGREGESDNRLPPDPDSHT